MFHTDSKLFKSTIIPLPLRSFYRRLSRGLWTIRNNSRFFLHLHGKLRRFYLVHFSKNYVNRQLENRKGQCSECGTCCNLLFTCPMLANDKRCFIYGSCRPQACKIFPINNKDIDEVRLCGKECGFYFDKSTHTH